jgi:2',3'-cyclic-nucleotide 2'-phosphodiesterase (5'-nucleotidase family)
MKREKNNLPLVQGGSYSDSFGEIVLDVNLDTMEIERASSSVIPITNIKKENKDIKVQESIDIEYN